MASNASVTINDGATTPLAHVFDPAGIADQTARYQNRAEVLVGGRETLVATLKGGKTVRTIEIQLRVPYVVDETMNAVTNRKVTSFATGKVVILVPVTWTPTQAKAFKGLLSNVISNPVFARMIEEDEFVW